MATHGGNRQELARRAGVSVDRLLDLSANINPLGPPPWFRQELEAGISELVFYPDPDCQGLRTALATTWCVSAEAIVAGNGSSELLAAVPAAWAARQVLLPVPCYGEYATACAGLQVVAFHTKESDGFRCDPARSAQAAVDAGCDLVLIGSPSNPAGAPLDVAALRAAARAYPALRWLVDEAFIELTEQASLLPDLPHNVAVLRSFTKSHACPGLRLGALVANPALITAVRRQVPPWSVNSLAQRIGVRACTDLDYLAASRQAIATARAQLISGLSDLGATVIPGAANYLLFRIGDHDGMALADGLLRRHAIALRPCADYPGLDRRWLRTAVRSETEQTRLLDALASELAQRKPLRRPTRRTPALMVQGTSSGAGKSVLVAALCRIFLQDGLRVCPFKAQNMSNNSGVTRDGLEMGRAQVVQAQAARLEPDVRMNPVLLKPNSDTGSQVVVLGKPIGNAAARPYMREMRERLRATVHQAYDALAGEHDLMVLEGAGSPGEVNLKRGDLVNMSMARHAGAAVLLVGDIDRGGLYASFVGHLEVMEEWERDLVGGLVVNRFRGDASLLGDAHAYVRRHTGKPVLGVIPFRRDLGLPEEDGVALDAWRNEPGTASRELDLALIELGHTSNFTDADPLRIEPDVNLRLVRRIEELGRPDAVIIPGSKNTLADLAGLRERGLANAVLRLASGGCEVVGICGGLQILGDTITDLHGIESGRGDAAGLGLIPVTTTLAPEKTLLRCAGTHLPSGLPLRGYEIHHGLTAMPEPLVTMRRQDGVAVGCRAPQGRVWGTYLHGVFNDDRFRRHWLDSLRLAKGLSPLGVVQATYDIDAAIDRLADLVRSSVDMDAIRRLAGIA